MKNVIENTVKDLVSVFLYYDRKSDEDLPLEAIENAIQNGEITKERIVEVFEKELTRRLNQ